MIQQIDRPKKKSRVFVFISFTPKQTKIKGFNKIQKYINGTFTSISANAQHSNNNCPKLPSKISFLSQVINANKGDLTNLESIVSSEANLNFDKGVDIFDLAIDANQD